MRSSILYAGVCAALVVLFVHTPTLLAQSRVFQSERAQTEAHIAVNPTDPLNFIATAITQANGTPNQIGYYYSFDGGQHWSGSDNISGDISAGDPVVAFDPDGTAYLMYQILTNSGQYLHKSTNGGQTWSSRIAIVEVDYPNVVVDRPWMTISPLRNSNGAFDVYVAHLEIHQGWSTTYTIRLRKSTNGGLSFNEIHSVSPSFGSKIQGASVAAGAAGEVFMAWAELNGTTNVVEKIKAKRSTNGGMSFADQTETTTYQIGAKDGGNNYYLKFLTGLRIRADSYPRVAVDTSPGPYQGHAYVVWSGKQSPTGNPDVLMKRWKRNQNGSFAWTEIEIVHASNEDQWMPAVDVSPDGVVSVLYYSSLPNDSDPVFTYLKYSSNGGASFSNVVNVGSLGGFVVEEFGETFLGDYHGVSNWFGKSFAIWTENKDHGSHNKRQAYFREVTTSLQIPSGYQIVEVSQLDEQGFAFEKIARWNQGAFTNYKAPHHFLLQTSSQETLRAIQQFKRGTTEKYNSWLSFSDTRNHNGFSVLPFQSPIRAQFRNAHNLTIRTELVDGGSGDGQMSVHFRDPWLIDFNDPPYGMRNRGQQLAEWYPHTSPFIPGTGTNYMGVFLNQNPVTSPGHYKVRAPLTPQTVTGK